MPEDPLGLEKYLDPPKPAKPSGGRVFSIQNAGDPSKWSLSRMTEVEEEFLKRTGKPLKYGRKGRGTGVGGWPHDNYADVGYDPGTPDAIVLEEILRAKNIPFKGTPIKGLVRNKDGRTISTDAHYHIGSSNVKPTPVVAPPPASDDPLGLEKYLDSPSQPPAAPPIAPPPAAPVVEPTTNPDGTLTRTFTPGQSYFLQPGQELPQRRARKAGGKVSTEPYTPEPVTVTYAPGQGEVVDVPQGMDVVTGRQRTVGPSPEEIRQRAQRRAQILRHQAQQRLQQQRLSRQMGNLTSAIPGMSLAALSSGVDPKHWSKAGIRPRPTIADLKQSEDPAFAEMNARDAARGVGARFAAKAAGSVGVDLADDQLKESLRADLRKQVLQERETSPGRFREHGTQSVGLVNGRTVDEEVERRLKDVTGGLTAKQILQLPYDEGLLYDLREMRNRATGDRLRAMGRGALSGTAGLNESAANLAEPLTWPEKLVGLVTGAEGPVTGLQKDLRKRAELQRNTILRDRLEQMETGGIGIGDEIGEGGVQALYKLAEIGALGKGIGATGLKANPASLMSLSSGVSAADKGVAPTAEALAEGYVRGKALSATDQYGKVANAVLQGGGAGVETLLRGGGLKEATTEAIIQGGMGVAQARGTRRLTEDVLRGAGFEPAVIRDPEGRTASIYVNPQTRQYVSRSIPNAEARPGRTVVDVPSEVFNQATRGGVIGRATGGRVDVGKRPARPNLESVVEPMGMPAPEQAGLRPQPRQLTGRAEMAETVVEAPTAPVAPTPEAQRPAGLPEQMETTPTAPVQPQGESAPVIRHSDPRIDGDRVVGKTPDGKLKVQGDDGVTHTVKNPRTAGNRNATIQTPKPDPFTPPVSAPLARPSAGKLGREPVVERPAEPTGQARTPSVEARPSVPPIRTFPPVVQDEEKEKQPWEMGRREFAETVHAARVRRFHEAEQRLNQAREGGDRESIREAKREFLDAQDALRSGYADAAHTIEIERALERGEDVPQSVLDDYPFHDFPARATTPQVSATQPRGQEQQTPQVVPAGEVQSPVAPETSTRNLTRNYRAGQNNASMTFASQLQKDLYDYGANTALSRSGGKNPRAQAATIDQIKQRIISAGIPESELWGRALDVRNDVRAQMKGVKDDESRTLVDNVAKPSAPEKPRWSTPQTVARELGRPTKTEQPQEQPIWRRMKDSPTPVTQHQQDAEIKRGRVIREQPEELTKGDVRRTVRSGLNAMAQNEPLRKVEEDFYNELRDVEDSSDRQEIVNNQRWVKRGKNGNKIDLFPRSYVVVREAITRYEERGGRITTGEAKGFSGLFLDPGQIRGVVRELNDIADAYDSERVRDLIRDIEGAAKHDGTVAFYAMSDKGTRVHEEQHRGGFKVARRGGDIDLEGRHASFDRLWNDRATQAVWRTVRPDYQDAPRGVALEETMAAIGEGIEGGDVSHLGVSLEDAVRVYTGWYESLARKNGLDTLNEWEDFIDESRQAVQYLYEGYRLAHQPEGASEAGLDSPTGRAGSTPALRQSKPRREGADNQRTRSEEEVKHSLDELVPEPVWEPPAESTPPSSPWKSRREYERAVEEGQSGTVLNDGKPVRVDPDNLTDRTILRKASDDRAWLSSLPRGVFKRVQERQAEYVVPFDHTPFLFITDRTRWGMYPGLNPGSRIKLPLQGGFGYSTMIGGWANDGGSTAAALNRAILRSPKGVGMAIIQGMYSHMSNLTAAEIFLREMQYHIQSGGVSAAAAIRNINKYVQNEIVQSTGVGTEPWRALVFDRIHGRGSWDKLKRETIQKYDKVHGKGAWMKDKENLKSIQIPKATEDNKTIIPTFRTLEDVRNGFGVFDARGWFFKKMIGATGAELNVDPHKLIREYNFPDMLRAANMMRDPRFDKVPMGHGIGLVQFDRKAAKEALEGKTFTAKDIGAPRHLSYAYVSPGKPMGLLKTSVDGLQLEPVEERPAQQFAALREGRRATGQSVTRAQALSDVHSIARASMPVAKVPRTAATDIQIPLRKAAGGSSFRLLPPVKQTEGENFKKWFGDSKVVDKGGNPLPVYHGTKGDFTSFNQDRRRAPNTEPGFFFAPDPEIASRYAGWDENFPAKEIGSVMPVYLRITNPLVVDFKGGKYGRREAIERARRAGHDGVHFLNHYDAGGVQEQWVAFKPEQIKSATGNRGTFSPTDPDILRKPPQEQIGLRPERKGEKGAVNIGSLLIGKRETPVLEIITSLRRAGLLASVKMHVRNTAGNAAFAISEEMSKPIAALADMAVKRRTGYRTTITPRPLSIVKGILGKEGAVIKGTADFWKVLFKGDPEANTKYERTDFKSGFPILDAYVDFTFNATQASDRWAKAYALSRALDDLAVVEAKNEGAKNTRQRAKELRQNPTEWMQREAITRAEIQTFQDASEVVRAITRAKQSLNNAGTLGRVLKFAVEMKYPFTMTPSNVFMRLLEYTPLGIPISVYRYKQIGQGAERGAFEAKEAARREKFDRRLERLRASADKRSVQEWESVNNKLERVEALIESAKDVLNSSPGDRTRIRTTQRLDDLITEQRALLARRNAIRKEVEQRESRRKFNSQDGLVTRAMADKIANEMFTKEEQARFAETVGRNGLGAVLGALTIAMMGKGLLELSGVTEFDDEKDKFFAKRAAGVKNCSVRVPGTDIRINILGNPMGNAICAEATAYEQAQRPGSKWEKAKAVAGGVREIAEQHPLLRPELKDDDDERTFEEKVAEFGASFMPRVWGEVAEIVDPKPRKSFGQGPAAQFKRNIPPGIFPSSWGIDRSSLPEPKTQVGGESERGNMMRRALRLVDPLDVTRQTGPQPQSTEPLVKEKKESTRGPSTRPTPVPRPTPPPRVVQ